MPKPSEALAAQADALRSELLELDAVEEPTEEQVARSVAALAEYDTTVASLEAARAHEAKIEAVRAATHNPANLENGFGGGVNVNIKRDPFENLDALRFADPNSEEVVARAVTAISDVRSRYTSDEHREAAVRTIEMIPGAAVHALVHGSPAYRSAFETWMRHQGQNPLYTPEEADAVRTALSLTGANGGYTLPTLFDPTLIKTGTAVKDPIRSIARVEMITQNVWHGVSVGNVTTAWKGEGSAFTEGSPTFSNPSITAAMLSAYLTGSYELFQDSSAIGQLPGLIGEAMSYAEQTAFVSGSGSGAPKGIVTAISATAGSTVTATTRGSFTSASSADLFAVVNAVTPRYEDSATWLGNKATFNTINQMSPNGAGSLFWQTLGPGVTNRPNLLGSPVVNSSDMSSATTSGTVLLILGDFSQYLIVDRIGMSVEYVQNVVDGNGLPTGQRGIIAYKRVGADVTDVNAFRFLKC